MHFSGGSLKCRRRPETNPMHHLLSDSASECGYSVRKGHSEPFNTPNWCFPSKTIGGRGPPGRRRRPELQAMSNSLQLASI